MRYVVASIALHVCVAGILFGAFANQPESITLPDITVSEQEVPVDDTEAPYIDYAQDNITYTELPDMSEFVPEDVPVVQPTDLFTTYVSEETVVCSTLESARAVADAIRTAGKNPLLGPDAYIVFWDNKECEFYGGISISLEETVEALRTADTHEFVAVVPLVQSVDEADTEAVERSYAIIVPEDVLDNVFRCTRTIEDMAEGVDGLDQCRMEL